jgi:hypothetical protein
MKDVSVQVKDAGVAKHYSSPFRCPISRSRSKTLLLEAVEGDGRK